jgi:hypothetical protein
MLSGPAHTFVAFVTERSMQDNFDTAHFGTDAVAGGHRYALAPMLLGLLAPALVILIVDARALSNPGPALLLYLVAIFGLATLAYVVSLFEAGDITRVMVDRAAREIIVEKTGLLTRYETAIPFADVAAIRIETRYDDNGYQTAIPIILLTDRNVVPLPAGTTESDIVRLWALVTRG